MRGAAASAGRLPRTVVWPRRLVALAVVAAALAAGYFLWLRDSGLVAVREVRVVGVSAANGEGVRAALSRAALQMTTLHVDIEALEAAVRPYPTVESVSADPSLPHLLTVEVTERHPVALIGPAASRVPVAGDGTVLEGIGVRGGDLPVIDAAGASASGPLQGEALEAARIAAATPPPLRSQADAISTGREGIEARLRNGIVLRFGDSAHAAEKWAAAARVLADPGFQGFAYLDLRVPERPAGGGVMTRVETMESAP